MENENTASSEPTYAETPGGAAGAGPESGQIQQNAGLDGAGLIYGKWMSEGEELMREYPTFVPRNEFRDPEFLALLKAGLSVKHAYHALRHDELTASAIREAEARAAQRTVNEIRAQGLRPGENAAAPKNAGGLRAGVRSMTSEEILDLIKQVQNGRKVSF